MTKFQAILCTIFFEGKYFEDLELHAFIIYYNFLKFFNTSWEYTFKLENTETSRLYKGQFQVDLILIVVLVS